MKKALTLIVLVGLFMACENESTDPIDDNPVVLRSKTYALQAVANPQIDGTATFNENSDGTVTIDLDLRNTPAGGQHPAHIHFNTAAEGGDVALTLGTVDGDTGESTVTTDQFNDGTALTYDGLLAFDGYINVHLSSTELSTLVAQGDIGGNELTGRSMSYNLDERDVAGISGFAHFRERENGSTLVTIELTGTPAGGSHPSHIHENDLATTGPVTVGLNPVNGDTGYSNTQVEELVDGTAVSYEDLLTIDAYINIHLSDADLATIVAQGNIGSNFGTGNGQTVSYDVVNSGATAYVFTGEGLNNSSNPDLTLKRGSTYTFNVTAPGHPFLIKSVQGTGTGNTFNDGVTNNGAVSGTVTFTVPANAPDTLFYNCEFHLSMTGTLNIVD